MKNGKIILYIGLGVLTLSSTAIAKNPDNRKLALEYCKVFRSKFPKKKCMIAKVGAGILPPYCPKGWHADKTFKKGSPNYASCIKGGKLKNHLNDVGFRKGNRGDAERLNTKNCNATEIKALNTAHLFLDKQWSKRKRETTKPTRTKDQNRKKKLKAVKAKLWKKLKKYITGQRLFRLNVNPRILHKKGS